MNQPTFKDKCPICQGPLGGNVLYVGTTTYLYCNDLKLLTHFGVWFDKSDKVNPVMWEVILTHSNKIYNLTGLATHNLINISDMYKNTIIEVHDFYNWTDDNFLEKSKDILNRILNMKAFF